MNETPQCNIRADNSWMIGKWMQNVASPETLQMKHVSTEDIHFPMEHSFNGMKTVVIICLRQTHGERYFVSIRWSRHCTDNFCVKFPTLISRWVSILIILFRVSPRSLLLIMYRPPRSLIATNVAIHTRRHRVGRKEEKKKKEKERKEKETWSGARVDQYPVAGTRVRLEMLKAWLDSSVIQALRNRPYLFFSSLPPPTSLCLSLSLLRKSTQLCPTWPHNIDVLIYTCVCYARVFVCARSGVQ